MSIMSTIGRLATDLRDARARYLTERAIRALPPEVQKDIGYPDVFDSATSRRRTGVH